MTNGIKCDTLNKEGKEKRKRKDKSHDRDLDRHPENCPQSHPGKPVYVASTLRIEVGVAWLLNKGLVEVEAEAS